MKPNKTLISQKSEADLWALLQYLLSFMYNSEEELRNINLVNAIRNELNLRLIEITLKEDHGSTTQQTL